MSLSKRKKVKLRELENDFVENQERYLQAFRKGERDPDQPSLFDLMVTFDKADVQQSNN